MKLVCAVICVISLSLNEVDSRPENLSHEEDSISTRDLRLKVDENMVKLLENLALLESKLLGVTDPDAEEESKRFKYFEDEIFRVTQDIYEEASGVCLGNETFPVDKAACVGNPMSYITEKFAPLYKRIEEFEEQILSHLKKDKNLKKENGSQDLGSTGVITARDIKELLRKVVSNIMLRFNRLERQLLAVISPDFEEKLKEKLVPFDEEFSTGFMGISDEAMRLCVGSDTDPEDTALCYRNPTSFITEKAASLNRTFDEFEMEIFLYLGDEKFLKEVKWNPEELLIQEGINNTQGLETKVEENLDNLLSWFINLEIKILRSVKPDFRVEFKRKFDSFHEEMIIVVNDIYRGDGRLCEESDTSPGHNAPCYRSRNEYLMEKTTSLYKMIKEFEEECRSFKKALEDGNVS